MTIKELETKISERGEENINRGGLVALMCLKRGVKDEKAIFDYIVKSYTVPSKEFAGRKLKTQRFAEKQARESIEWMKLNKLIK